MSQSLPALYLLLPPQQWPAQGPSTQHPLDGTLAYLGPSLCLRIRPGPRRVECILQRLLLKLLLLAHLLRAPKYLAVLCLDKLKLRRPPRRFGLYPLLGPCVRHLLCPETKRCR